MGRPRSGGKPILVSFLLLGIVACSDDETVDRDETDPTSDASITAICDLICDCECPAHGRDGCFAELVAVRDRAEGTSCELVVEEYYRCVLHQGVCTSSGDFSDDACDHLSGGENTECLSKP